MANATLILLACLDSNNLFVFCVSSPSEAVYTLHLCWRYGVFLLILFLLLLRALAFGALWIVLGKCILVEEETLKELFQFWPKKDEDERPKWTARLFFCISSCSNVNILQVPKAGIERNPACMMETQNVTDDSMNNVSEGSNISNEYIDPPKIQIISDQYEAEEIGNVRD
ncbi:hypothetical protein ACJIZ3_012013 [Penstemon smallii]|uniref:Uncharacterized protein n=1 Tax=Penstemon smallii TaxID=265156 RepID=A0ABD3UKS4_9LAMI